MNLSYLNAQLDASSKKWEIAGIKILSFPNNARDSVEDLGNTRRSNTAASAIGIVWGTTNALIKRGTLISEQHKNERRKKSLPLSNEGSRFDWLVNYIEEWQLL
ncbi:hypothetical protein SUGI_0594500 [Cryptomeria japonica]|nr:hypothetical protein SUGI_0594500 [Cryptomeria japonica]